MLEQGRSLDVSFVLAPDIQTSSVGVVDTDLTVYEFAAKRRLDQCF